MGVLTKSQILKEIESKMIVISPFDPKNLGTNSYDLTLFPELETYDYETLDPKKPETFKTSKIKIPDEGLLIFKNNCYLGRTNEYTETYNFVPVLQGKSSMGRMFLGVAENAGYGDIGFKGHWTLNLKPAKDVYVYPNMKIVQIEYNTVEGIIRHTYNGKYQNSKEIQPSKVYEEYKNEMHRQKSLGNEDIDKALKEIRKIETD